MTVATLEALWNCQLERTITNSIYITTNILYTIHVFYFLYIHFIRKSEGKKVTKSANENNKLTKYSLLIMTIATLTRIILGILFASTNCELSTESTTYLNLFWILAFGVQVLMWTLCFFIRIYFVFKGTIHKLSPCTTYFYPTYWTIYILYIIGASIYGYYLHVHSPATDTDFLIWTGGFMFLFIAISLSILFIYKLYQVYKANKSEPDEYILRIITIITILNTTALLITLIDVGDSVIYQEGKSIWYDFVENMFTDFDVYMNWLCVILTFKRYNNWYMRLCGGLHNKCIDNLMNKDGLKLQTYGQNDDVNNRDDGSSDNKTDTI